MKIGIMSDDNFTQVPSLFGEEMVLIKTTEGIASQVAKNLDQDNPKQLRIPFSYSDKNYNSRTQTTEEKYNDTMKNLEETLQFIDIYKNQIQQTTNLLTLSKEDKESVIKTCDTLLDYLKPIASKVTDIAATKVMYEEVVKKLNRLIENMKRTDIDGFYQNCNYIIDSYNKDFYQHKDEKKIEGFLESVDNAKKYSQQLGAPAIKESFIQQAKSLATLNYSIHKDTGLKNEPLNQLMGLGGVNNSKRDDITADMAYRIVNDQNLNTKDIEEIWKRFINLNYMLINDTSTGVSTEEGFNQVLDHFKTTGEVVVAPGAKIYQQKEFIQQIIKNTKNNALTDGYVCEFDKTSNRFIIKNKSGFFASMKSLTQKGSAELYNMALKVLYEYHDDLVNFEKDLQNTRNELAPDMQKTIQKIPAFFKYMAE